MTTGSPPNRWLRTLTIWTVLVGLFLLFIAGNRPSSAHLSKLVLPLVAIAAIVIVFLALLSRVRGNQQSVLELRKTRARLLAETSKVRFAEVGGLDDAKARLADVIDFLKNPAKWAASGARLPKGVLLEGPPGCGKTLLARAVAGEAQVPFYFVSASEFVEMFIGVGAARVRDTFEVAAKSAPAVIFIDELDAVGRRRGSGITSTGHEEREMTLNQLLVSLDGFERKVPLVVMAATNRADILDSALLRAGRFDWRIRVTAPDQPARESILAVHTRNKRLGADVMLADIAMAAEGLLGADLELACNEAALRSVRRGAKQHVTREDFEEALAAIRAAQRNFDRLDAALIESSTQLSEPGGRAVVRLSLDDGTEVRGDLIWADARFIKIRREGTDGAPEGAIIVAKDRVRWIQSQAGTERAGSTPDAWADVIADIVG